jgi:hypothetical protein
MTAESLVEALRELRRHFGHQVEGFWDFNIYSHAVRADGSEFDLPQGSFLTIDASGLGRERPTAISEHAELVPRHSQSQSSRATQQNARPLTAWQAEDRRVRARVGEDCYHWCRDMARAYDLRIESAEALDRRIKDALKDQLTGFWAEAFDRDPVGLVDETNAILDRAWSEHPSEQPQPWFFIGENGKLHVRRSRDDSKAYPLRAPFNGQWASDTWLQHAAPGISKALENRRASVGELWNSDVELAFRGFRYGHGSMIPAGVDVVQWSKWKPPMASKDSGGGVAQALRDSLGAPLSDLPKVSVEEFRTHGWRATWRDFVDAYEEQENVDRERPRGG